MSKLWSLQNTDLEQSLPAIASSLTQSQGFSPHHYVLPEKRKVISDVRRTFCLFVTFDLLFISLLWLIELNVSWDCWLFWLGLPASPKTCWQFIYSSTWLAMVPLPK